MCGITGFIDKRCSNLEELAHLMANQIAHRGPDDHGVWVDDDLGIAFGHRRLSILDLSIEGHQPMTSPSGRYVIIFNGEIYNYNDFKADLLREGFSFRGTSDTEAMLAAFEAWGVEAAVEKFNGMFAFALWDNTEKRLFLARDRIGIKPLYYGWSNGCFIFGSELKPFWMQPHFKSEIDRDSLSLLFRFNYIPSPHCIYEGIYKLPAGCILSLGLDDFTNKPSDFSPYRSLEKRNHQPNAYWSVKEKVQDALLNPFKGNDQEAIDQLEHLLEEAVKARMISDVPLGAFLSGGIDSSVVVSLMQKISSQPVKTFSIGFNEQQYNEAEYAKEIAEHLGTSHTNLYLNANEALDLIPLMPHFYDEPFSDASQIPTYLVSRLARSEVTVSLSGDGGDELFVGYERYALGQTVWKLFGRIPWFLRKVTAGAITIAPDRLNNALFNLIKPIFPLRFQKINVARKFDNAAAVIKQRDFALMYRRLVSHWFNAAELVIGAKEPDTDFSIDTGWLKDLSVEQKMQYLDMVTYLPEDILTKVDRASMAVSLEARVPLLDHRVIEFAWTLPNSMKVRGNRKWVLREVLKKHVPEKMFDRPKTGFGIPISAWLKSDLRDWAEALLDETRLKNEGFLEPELVRSKWKEHLYGNQNWEYYLWDVLMFQAWLENISAPQNFQKEEPCRRESA